VIHSFKEDIAIFVEHPGNRTVLNDGEFFCIGIKMNDFFSKESLIMVEVTELAIKNLKSYMQENKIDSPLRIALMQGG
jgi:hypothetical protein